MWFSSKSQLDRGKESACQCRRPRLDPWVGKIPWRREWQPTPVVSPGETNFQFRFPDLIRSEVEAQLPKIKCLDVGSPHPYRPQVRALPPRTTTLPPVMCPLSWKGSQSLRALRSLRELRCLALSSSGKEHQGSSEVRGHRGGCPGGTQRA